MRSPRAAADMCMGMEINPKVRWPFQTVVAMWTLLQQQAETVHELFKISRLPRQESSRILSRWFISQLDVSLHRRRRLRGARAHEPAIPSSRTAHNNAAQPAPPALT